MALLIPAATLAAGTAYLAFVAWRNREMKGSLFAAFLYVTAFAGPLACVALGAWGMVRTGKWTSIEIGDILGALAKAGIGAFLREPAPWPVLQALNQAYLASDVAWTLLVVPGLLIAFWLAVTWAPAASPK